VKKLERELPKGIRMDEAKNIASWSKYQYIPFIDNDSRYPDSKLQCYGIREPRNRILVDTTIRSSKLLQMPLQEHMELKMKMRRETELEPMWMRSSDTEVRKLGVGVGH
jgi:hypothetical protein